MSFSEAIDCIGEYTETLWWCVYAGKRHVTLRMRMGIPGAAEYSLTRQASNAGLKITLPMQGGTEGWVTLCYNRP